MGIGKVTKFGRHIPNTYKASSCECIFPTASQNIFQQKKTLRIPEVVDQQDFSNNSVLESLTQSLEVTQ